MLTCSRERVRGKTQQPPVSTLPRVVGMCLAYFPPHHWLPLPKRICLENESLGYKTRLALLLPKDLGKGSTCSVHVHMIKHMHVYACLSMCWLWRQGGWRQKRPCRGDILLLLCGTPGLLLRLTSPTGVSLPWCFLCSPRVSSQALMAPSGCLRRPDSIGS